MLLLNGNDMAKLGCGDCSGCSSCCKGMGQSILLDPYDIFQLQIVTGQNFVGLMQEKIELCVEDGMILPALKMQPGTDACGFLSREGRCSIHAYRPGLCRLFPLGRKYDEKGLHYFLLEDACQMKTRTKIKIKKWLEISSLSQYENFLTAWHDLRKDIQEQIVTRQADGFTQNVNVQLLEIFFKRLYDSEENFYVQFENRKDMFYKFVRQWAE